YILGNGTLGNELNVDGSEMARPMLADLNGDGITDAIWPEPYNGAQVLYTILGQASPTPIDYAGNDETETGIDAVGTSLVPIDFNSDGLTDFLWDNQGDWTLLESNGKTLINEGSTGIPSPSNVNSTRVADINGDGLSDLIWAGSDGNWHYRLHQGLRPDLVIRITDGLGNYFAPTYAPLTQTGYTEGSSGTYPNIDITIPLNVVTSYTANDPANSSYVVSYQYSGARLNMQGRGFLGFAEIKATDSRNNVTVTTGYSQDYRTAGAPTHITSVAGVTLSNTTITNLYKSYGSTSSHNDAWFAYVADKTDEYYGANGEAIKQVTTTNTYNTEGELTNQTTGTGAVGGNPTYTSTVATQYSDDSTHWCYGLPSQVTVTRSGLSRVTTYANDTTYCRHNDVTVDAGGDLPLKTTYTYDVYGNKTRIDVTGSGLSGRTTTIDYGINKDFPVTVTNALGQVRSLTWGRGLGVESSVTDVNGHKSTWTYDDFGRKTREVRPDGSETDWSYSSCGVDCGQYGSYAITVDISASGVAGGHSETIYNSFGQPVEQRQLTLGGKTSITDIQYNAFGKKSSVTTPYFSGPATYCTTYTYDVLGRVTATDS
ncbi:MAG TPA: toxin TcdB middle/N-terminal domain-containing protein, partial [Candidatus Saccharimonadales bacterium]|nr:toxin TcdB middle/N-terminal domain-containing protein [Candidatus Saccharimonadales bacterium]